MRLTPKRQRLVGLINKGMTNREIALELKVSEKAVKDMATRVFKIFNVKNRNQLMAITGQNFDFSKIKAYENKIKQLELEIEFLKRNTVQLPFGQNRYK
jgi:DNA-binding CsgD family transcriptional regulator